MCAIFEKTDILKKYDKFEDMFINNIMDLLLSKHEKWDYEIILKSEIKFTCELIYLLLIKKLKFYLNENLKKGYIRLLIFSAGYPILFIFKKNGKLRLCVDYRQLNNIIVKNRYILLKIDELLDRI